jgi:hypothetical protein
VNFKLPNLTQGMLPPLRLGAIIKIPFQGIKAVAKRLLLFASAEEHRFVPQLVHSIKFLLHFEEH